MLINAMVMDLPLNARGYSAGQKNKPERLLPSSQKWIAYANRLSWLKAVTCLDYKLMLMVGR
jgi:hypothetical protein